MTKTEKGQVLWRIVFLTEIYQPHTSNLVKLQGVKLPHPLKGNLVHTTFLEECTTLYLKIVWVINLMISSSYFKDDKFTRK